MRKLRAFMLGMWEFRLSCTTNFDNVDTDEGYSLQNAYDWGREWAHRLTLRRYEES